jgi:hypothetical protein
MKTERKAGTRVNPTRNDVKAYIEKWTCDALDAEEASFSGGLRSVGDGPPHCSEARGPVTC